MVALTLVKAAAAPAFDEPVRGLYFHPVMEEHTPMRAEIETIVDEIEQGMALLRRHL